MQNPPGANISTIEGKRSISESHAMKTAGLQYQPADLGKGFK